MAWTRVTESDGRPGQWYLHLFTPEQPDVDWTNPEVQEDFDETMRFWFALGVDGFRIDVAHGLAKADGLPDVGSIIWPPVGSDRSTIPTGTGTRSMTSTGRGARWPTAYEDPRVFVAEAWVHHPERLAQYVRGDELHTAFNFDFLLAPWQADRMSESIVAALTAHEARRRSAHVGPVQPRHGPRGIALRPPPGRPAFAQARRPRRFARRLRGRAAAAHEPPRC